MTELPGLTGLRDRVELAAGLLGLSAVVAALDRIVQFLLQAMLR